MKSAMKSFSAQAVLAVSFATLTGVGIISLFIAPNPVRIVVAGGAVLAVVMYLSGNARIICLWGLVISAPLNLGKDFMVVPHMGGAGSYSIDLIDVFIIALLCFITRDFYWGHRKRVRISWVSIWWCGLILLGMVTMAMGPLRNVAGHETVRMIKSLILFWVIINEVVRVRQFMHILGALSLGVIVESILAFAQYFLRRPIGLEVLGEATAETLKYASLGTYTGVGDTYRVGALLGHPNLLSAYLALLIPVMIVFLFTRIRPAHKAGLAIATGLGLVALILTLSRSGWISFAFAFAVMMSLSFIHPRFKHRFLVARIAIIAGVAIVALSYSGEIIKRITKSDTGAVGFRREWIQVSWKMIQDKPVMGFGLNSFAFNMPPYTSYGGPLGITQKFGQDWPVVHNVYLLTMVEQGTIGLLIFIAFHFHVIWIALRNLKFFDNEILYNLNIGCLSGFLAMMTDGLASFYLRNPCGRVFWIVVALIIAINYWNRANRSTLTAAPTPTEEQRPELA